MKTLLKALYESEINIAIDWMWDSGVQVKIGDRMNGFKEATIMDADFDEIERWIEAKVKEHYPDSKFAKTYKGEDFASAFRKELDEVFENIPNEEDCKTVVEAYLVQQINCLKSMAIDSDCFSELVDNVLQNFEPKKCMPDGINSKEEHEQYLKDIGYEKYIKNLEHYKETTVGLYATDKEPEKIFEEVFVHLIEDIGLDGEKTFSPMDYEYYRDYFNKGIKLLMWRIS